MSTHLVFVKAPADFLVLEEALREGLGQGSKFISVASELIFLSWRTAPSPPSSRAATRDCDFRTAILAHRWPQRRRKRIATFYSAYAYAGALQAHSVIGGSGGRMQHVTHRHLLARSLAVLLREIH